MEKTTGGLSKKGTYTYMAPEVYREQPYGASADLYSLGLVLYRLLNDNRAPFLPPYPQPITHSDRENALAKRMSGAPLPPPCSARGSLAGIVLKACAYQPKDRYLSPEEFRHALEEALQEEQSGSLPADAVPLPERSVRNIPTETSEGPAVPFHPAASSDRTVSAFPQEPPEKTVSAFSDPAPQQPVPQPSVPRQPAKKRSKLPLILGGAAVVVILLLVLVLGGGSEDDPAGPSSGGETVVIGDINPDFANADKEAVTFEDPANAFYAGKNQVARSTLIAEDTVLLQIGNRNYNTTNYTREQFEPLVTGLKDRLDLLGVPYAFAYSGSAGEDFAVRLSPEVLGLQTMMLLQSYTDALSQSDSCYAGNARKDLELTGIQSLTCALDGDSWTITVTLNETDAGTLKAYLSGDPQSALYFAIPGGIVFGHMDLSELTDNTTLVFHGIDCIASTENQGDYAFLMDLMTYAFDHPMDAPLTVVRALREDSLNLEASDGGSNQVEDTVYGVQYVTAVDEQVFAAIRTAFPAAEVRRPVDVNTIYASTVNVFMHDDAPDGMSAEESRQYSLDIVEQAYTLGGFDGGSYSFVWFFMGSGGSIGFEKDETGTMRVKDVPDAYMDLVIASDFYLPKLYPGVLKTYQEEGWVYDAAGRVTREVQYDKDGTVSATLEADYDEAGNMIAYRHYQSDGQLTQLEEYTYDSLNRLTEAFSYDPSTGELQGRIEYTYDADGNRSGTQYNADGEVVDQF